MNALASFVFSFRLLGRSLIAELLKNSQIVAPAESHAEALTWPSATLSQRERASATPHKEAFEDGGEMAVFQQLAL